MSFLALLLIAIATPFGLFHRSTRARRAALATTVAALGLTGVLGLRDIYQQKIIAALVMPHWPTLPGHRGSHGKCLGEA